MRGSSRWNQAVKGLAVEDSLLCLLLCPDFITYACTKTQDKNKVNICYTGTSKLRHTVRHRFSQKEMNK